MIATGIHLQRLPRARQACILRGARRQYGQVQPLHQHSQRQERDSASFLAENSAYGDRQFVEVERAKSWERIGCLFADGGAVHLCAGHDRRARAACKLSLLTLRVFTIVVRQDVAQYIDMSQVYIPMLLRTRIFT